MIDTVPLPEKVALAFASKRDDFQKQIKEVKKKYPLVYQEYLLQQIALIELSSRPSIAATLAGSLSGDPTIRERVMEIEANMNRCRTNFYRDVGIAGNDQGALMGALETFTKCIRNSVS